MPRHPAPRLSFEVFPGKTPRGTELLMEALGALKPLDPDFVSVTCGAGGSRRTTNCDMVARIQDEIGVPVAAHMTAIAASEEDVAWLADRYRAIGVGRLVALRGDRPRDAGTDPGPARFRYANELVAWLSQRGGFDIAVAAYPETHPEAPSADADIDALKRKVDAGATTAITQFFFDAERFLRFRDRIRRHGITVPLVPGILPIQSFERTRKMAADCQARIPHTVADAFASAGEDPARQAAVSLEVSAGLCARLAEEGVAALHIYTLNKAAPTLRLAERLGWLPDPAPRPRSTAADRAPHRPPPAHRPAPAAGY